MNILAIIQARMGSSRLPGKVLLELEGQTILEHVIDRVLASKYIDSLVVATTLNKEDQIISDICIAKGVKSYRGSADDVLERFYNAAKLYKADNIVRITADCPLIDPDIIDETIRMHLDKKVDYTSNTLEYTFPDGLNVEVVTFEALKIAFKDAKLKSEREHVTPYIKKHDDIFRMSNLMSSINYVEHRWTLDYKEDFEFMKIVYKNLYKINHLFKMHDILRFVEKNKEILEINKHIKRDEGYEKSLKEDQIMEQVSSRSD